MRHKKEEQKKHIRYEHRCKCGNVVAAIDKIPQKFVCPGCGRKGEWGEKYIFPAPVVNEITSLEIPPLVMLDGKPHMIINDQYVLYDDGLILVLKNRVEKDLAQIKELENKKLKNAEDKK